MTTKSSDCHFGAMPTARGESTGMTVSCQIQTIATGSMALSLSS